MFFACAKDFLCLSMYFQLLRNFKASEIKHFKHHIAVILYLARECEKISQFNSKHALHYQYTHNNLLKLFTSFQH